MEKESVAEQQKIEIRVYRDGVLSTQFNASDATALDTLAFLHQIVEVAGLERMAQKEGRTFDHPLARSVGAVSVDGAVQLRREFTKDHV